MTINFFFAQKFRSLYATFSPPHKDLIDKGDSQKKHIVHETYPHLQSIATFVGYVATCRTFSQRVGLSVSLVASTHRVLFPMTLDCNSNFFLPWMLRSTTFRLTYIIVLYATCKLQAINEQQKEPRRGWTVKWRNGQWHGWTDQHSNAHSSKIP